MSLSEEQKELLKQLTTEQKAFLLAVYEVADKVYEDPSEPIWIEDINERHVGDLYTVLLKDFDFKTLMVQLFRADMLILGEDTGHEIVKLSRKAHQLIRSCKACQTK